MIRSTEYDTPRTRATHRSTHGKCWGFSQHLIAAYAHPDRRRGKTNSTEASINGRLMHYAATPSHCSELRAPMRGRFAVIATLGLTPSILLRSTTSPQWSSYPTTPTRQRD